MTNFTPAAGNHTSTSLEFQPLELLPGDLLLRPLGAFEELFCLFDQRFPTNGALAAQITGHTTVQHTGWRCCTASSASRHSLIRMLTRIISLSITAALAVPLLAQTSTPANTVSEPTRTAVRELIGSILVD